MTGKLDADAWAQVGDTDLDARDGVQEVDASMIYAYVIRETLLPDYSARPFSYWLNAAWFAFTEEHRGGLLTNRDVIHGAITDWCGGRTQ